MSAINEWQAAWSLLGVAGPPGGLLGEVVSAYSEPGRHYHNLAHIEECFGHLKAVGPEVEDRAAVALALWFHDAVYDPRRSDNEARSADWAEQALGDAGIDAPILRSVRDLIQATDHRTPPASGDQRILVDVDLAILGADPDRFDEYERQVRLEYAWVPDLDFREGRAKILSRFIDRPNLYATGPFRRRFEVLARENIARSLRNLGP